MLIRPGPAQIEAGACPGGVVIHVYAVPSQRLLIVRPSRTAAETELHAVRDADEAMAALHTFERGVCLVAYDGDTGDRMAWP